MKRIMLVALLLIAALALAACGGKDNKVEAAEAPEAAFDGDFEVEDAEFGEDDAAVLLDDAGLAALLGEDEYASAALDEGMAGFFSDDAADIAFAREPGVIDLDLTTLSSTVVYSQVYQMLMTPEAYEGATIRMRGNLSYFQDPDTGKEYFAAVIQDATACCAQGIEFVWAGEHSYPRDYPALDTEVTVTGVFDAYEEDDNLYIQLVDCDVTWDGQKSV